MPKILALVKLIEKTNTWLGKIFAWGIVVIAVTVTLDMVTRYFLNAPQIWCHEFAMLVFGPYLILGGAYAVITDEHIKMDVFSSNWSKKSRAIINALLIPFVLIVLGILLWQSSIIVWDSMVTWEKSGSAWNPIIWPVTMAVPFATFILILQLIATTIKDSLVSVNKI